MLTISRETDYACRVMFHLAMLPAGGHVTAQQIARGRIIPRAIVRRVITRLSKAHLVITTRGKGGGLTLARPANEISLLDIVQAMEGPISLNACVAAAFQCPLMKTCSIHEAWGSVHDMVLQQLGGATLAKLAERGRELNSV